jgi:hypothetical protein
MATDPGVRTEAEGILGNLFHSIGQHAQGQSPGVAGGLLGQFQEFVEMPMELAQVFLDMGVQLTELVLRSLEEGGIILTKGLTPL